MEMKVSKIRLHYSMQKDLNVNVKFRLDKNATCFVNNTIYSRRCLI